MEAYGFLPKSKARKVDDESLLAVEQFCRCGRCETRTLTLRVECLCCVKVSEEQRNCITSGDGFAKLVSFRQLMESTSRSRTGPTRIIISRS